IDDIAIDGKKVTITLDASKGLDNGNAKFQTEGTGTPLTGKADDGTTAGTAATGGRTANSRIAAGGIATIEVNCSTELEANEMRGLLLLKDSVRGKHAARAK
ncbi:31260_t:CDS:2, partial [Racocetra persica]